MTKEYHRLDLIDAIDKMYGRDYAGKSGVLSAVLESVLLTVEVWEPGLFEDIMRNEMAVQEKVKQGMIKGELNDE